MKCKCGKKSVFYRKYEGKAYCKACFCESIEKKVKRTVRKNFPLKAGDRIAAAISGGKDSSVALYLMQQIIKPRKDVKMFAITVDEGIGGYRPDTIKAAKKLCKKLGVKHHIYSFKKELGKELDNKLEEKRGETACTFCGVGRRYILNKASRELRANKLLVGHNLDDETQSVVMNFFRGDLLRASRLDAKPLKHHDDFVVRTKPLREIPEKEITLYALLKGLEVCSDECPNVGGFRFEVRDFINMMEDRYPGTKFSVLESFDKLVPFIKKGISYRHGKILSCEICGEPSSRKKCKTCELWGQ